MFHPRQLTSLKDRGIILVLATLCFSPLLRKSTLFLLDDTYIYIRVVQNLLDHGQWAFNTGEPLNPCSSFLYPFLLYVGMALGVSGPTAALTLSCLGLFLISSISYCALRETKRNRIVPLLASALVLINPLYWRCLGLETHLFLAFAMLSVWYSSKDNSKIAAICVCISILTRIDGVWLVPACYLSQWLSSRKHNFYLFVSGFIGLALPLCWSLLLFDSLLPHSIEAKMAQSGLRPWSYTSWFQAWFESILISPYLVLLSSLTTLFYLCFHLKNFIHRFLVTLGIFSFLHVVNYSFFSAPIGYFWYYLPGSLGFELLAIFGFSLLINNFRSTQHYFSENMALMLGGTFILLFHLPIQVYGMRPYRHSRGYKAVCSHVNSQPGSVASNEIGYVGAACNSKVIDMLAIVTSGALSHIKKNEFWWWLEKEPMWVITHEGVKPWLGEPDSSTWPPEKLQEFNNLYVKKKARDGVVLWKRRCDEIDLNT